MASGPMYILGGGGHARVIASMVAGGSVFVVPQPATADELAEAQFFDRIADYRDQRVVVGIGANDVRTRLFDRLVASGIRPTACISSHAFIARDAEIGAGAVICPGAVVNARARIGDNAIVNTLAGIDHDCVLGDHTQVAPGVSLGGTVTIGESCFLGIKSAVFPNVTIGNRVKVMGGSLVTKAVRDDVQVGGIPARIVKELSHC